MNFIRKAMWGVVDHGTAAAAKLPLDGIQMAGKTGTAQTHNLSAGERGNYTARRGSCATTRCSWPSRPFDNPRYAAATIVEHGGFGAAVAAPLVRDTMTYLYDKQKALAALDAFEQSIGGTPERAPRPQDRGMALRQRPAAAPAKQA